MAFKNLKLIKKVFKNYKMKGNNKIPKGEIKGKKNSNPNKSHIMILSMSLKKGKIFKIYQNKTKQSFKNHYATN